MADLSAIRHALNTARDRGFAEVTVADGETKFSAVLGAPKARASRSSTLPTADGEDMPATPAFAAVKAPMVGYYRPGPKPLVSGQRIEAGDIVAVISQLGIANDVEAKVSGDIIELCVEENQAVGYGQVIATVRED